MLSTWIALTSYSSDMQWPGSLDVPFQYTMKCAPNFYLSSFLTASKRSPHSNWSDCSPNGSNVKSPLYCSIFGRNKRGLISGLPCTDDASGRVPEYAVCTSAGCASILMKKSDVASFDEVKAVVCIGQMSKSAIYFVAMKAIHPENI